MLSKCYCIHYGFYFFTQEETVKHILTVLTVSTYNFTRNHEPKYPDYCNYHILRPFLSTKILFLDNKLSYTSFDTQVVALSSSSKHGLPEYSHRDHSSTSLSHILLHMSIHFAPPHNVLAMHLLWR